ncbi:exocyst complex component 7-like [Oscarella lobularis]|uniref:exocyst complex component 7-like n=1 Tax=Oscarella lobularis TaxID=121494 RepID=UPI003314358D
MEEIAAKRRGIELKLDQDRSALDSLKASLGQTRQNTDSMVAILDSFENRLQKLDDAIKPVHKETVLLTRLQDNVARTLKSLDRIIGFYNVASSVEPIIREGPTGCVDHYLKQMARLQAALDFFQENNPHSVELATLTSLSDLGRDMLNREFRTLLNRHSKPVPVSTLTDMISAPDDEAIALDHLPEKVMDDLSAIANWLARHSSSEFMNVYAQIRSNQVKRSIQGLKDAYTTTSSSTGIAAMAKHRQTPTSAKDTPLKRGGTRKVTQKRLSRIAFESPGGVALSLKRGSVEGPGVLDLYSDDRLEGTTLFLNQCTLFLRLMQAEKKLMRDVIPPGYHDRIFEVLIQVPFDYLIVDGEALHTQAKKAIAENSYAELLSALQILRRLNELQPEFANALKGLKGKPGSRLSLLAELFKGTCLAGLNQYADFVKADPDKRTNLPKDGTVHELTSNTVSYIELLLEYSDTVGQLLVVQEGAHVNPSLGAKKAMGAFLYNLLGKLGLNLELKARGYEDMALSCIFLLNNYHFIHKSLTRNDDFLTTVEEHSSDVEDYYMQLIGEQRRTYQKCWQKVIHHLLEINKTLMTLSTEGPRPGEKLSKKQRQAIKDKFKGFNTELADLQSIQKRYAIPDERLRRSLREDNVECIVPHYTKFYERYAKAQFTKNPEKYLKHRPEDVERILETSFFDATA